MLRNSKFEMCFFICFIPPCGSVGSDRRDTISCQLRSWGRRCQRPIILLCGSTRRCEYRTLNAPRSTFTTFQESRTLDRISFSYIKHDPFAPEHFIKKVRWNYDGASQSDCSHRSLILSNILDLLLSSDRI